MTHIKHWGIKGMRWGVRKQRGPDSEDHTKTVALKGKVAAEMTNKEIQAVITRVGLERQLSTINPPKTHPALAFVGAVLQNPAFQAIGKEIIREKTGVDLNNPFSEDSKQAMLSIAMRLRNR